MFSYASLCQTAVVFEVTFKCFLTSGCCLLAVLSRASMAQQPPTGLAPQELLFPGLCQITRSATKAFPESSSGRRGSRYLAPRQALEPAQSSCSQEELRPALRPLLTAQHRTYYILEAAQSCDLHDDDGFLLSFFPLCESSDYPKLAEQVLQKMCLYTCTYAQYTRHTHKLGTQINTK